LWGVGVMKKILVTGGAGFIGSHLCETLLREGNDVLCVDNLFTGDKKNIVHLMDNPYFQFLRHDITLPLYVEVDEIYNLACPASPIHYQHNPVQTVKASVFGSINLLGLAKRTGARILQASTSEIYGNPTVHPQPESYWGNVNPLGSRACYDEGKRCAETLFMSYYHGYRVRVKIVRIFNTYGPQMPPSDGRVIPNFIVQALNNEPITIYGDGFQTRCFCYVDDLVKGITAMMKMPEDYTGPVNLGSPAELRIIDIAEMIINLTGSSSKLIYKALPQDDPRRRQPDIRKAREELNWQPEIAIKDGLKKTIAYFESVRNQCVE